MSELRNLAPFLGYLASLGDGPLTPTGHIELLAAVDLMVVDIDHRVASLLDAVLHTPAFQRLEASWRGLHHLVHGIGRGENVQVILWSAPKEDLLRDLEEADHITRSHAFAVIYTAEYGQFGGQPYASVFFDFEVTNHPRDIALLRSLGSLGAMAHVGMFLGAPPTLVGVRKWAELRDASDAFEGPAYTAWRSFRESEESRYIGLVLPRELMRAPYDQPAGSVFYVETVEATGHGLLWGSPLYSLAIRFARVFARTGLLGTLVGADEDSPQPAAYTESRTLGARCPKSSLEVTVSPRLERQLRDLGLITVQQMGDRLTLPSAHSLAQPKTFGGSQKGREATINHLLGTRFPYLFIALRFAHYLKVIERECIGGAAQASDIERRLSEWLNQFVANQDGASAWIRAARPLRQVKVTVSEVPGAPGVVESRVLLRPHVRYLGSLLALDVYLPDLSRFDRATSSAPVQPSTGSGT